MRSGTVEGKYVKNILLDTGCSKTLVHQKLVPEEAFLEATTVCCANGDSVVPLGKDAHALKMLIQYNYRLIAYHTPIEIL